MRGGSAVKSSGCSCRGLGLASPLPNDGSELSVPLVPDDPRPSSNLNR